MTAIDEVHQGRAEEFGLLGRRRYGWHRRLQRGDGATESRPPSGCNRGADLQGFRPLRTATCKREYFRRQETPGIPPHSAFFTADYVAGVPNGDAITIEHLLNHTSGLFSANEDRRVRARPSDASLSLDDELSIARRHGAMFGPGERWRYTNTGYALLGAVTERLESSSFADVVQRRALARLGLASLRILAPSDPALDVGPLAALAPGAPRVPPS